MIGAKLAKYRAVGVITLRHQLAYMTDFLLRSVFLLLILFIFVQLWSAAYAGTGEPVVAGFTLKQIVWYLVFTEALTMAFPHLCLRVEDEIKQGDIAIRLVRPLSYIGYHYMAFLGEAALRFVVHLAAGSAIAWCFVGPPAFGAGWAGLLALSAGAMTVAFLLNVTVALCAFWVEETRGLEFVLQKLQFTVGGMLLPIDMMPDWLQRVCAWLPFQAVLYMPARTAVDFAGSPLARFLAVQAAWTLALAVLAVFIYRRGVRRLHVNGG
jgi:ABC-2 type transport system permease protein